MSSSSPHRDTSPVPPHRRTRLRSAAVALAGVAALVAAAVQSGPATAAPTAPPAKGAGLVALSPAQRAGLIRDAGAATARTAAELGLGAKEKLVVRDVVKDRDGTLHTRYERTYDGLPVLGGDFVVESRPGGAPRTATVTRAVAPATVTPKISAAGAETRAIAAARAAGAEKPDADRAPRRVVWAAQGTPVLAYETVVGGLQEDGTPSSLHVVTDAATGAELYQYQAVHKGTGNTLYSGTVTLGTAQSGSSYSLTDTARGNHKTYNLNRGTSGTGTLYSGADDVWGNGTAADSETAAADAHYGAALTWDYYKQVHGRSGIRGDGVGAYSRVHYGNAYVNAFWDDSCFCMTYGDGTGNSRPLTAIDVAGHEMTHGVTSNTAGLVYSGESGGLNEATSDIFGTSAEFFAANASDVGDYLIGEKININGNGTPLRYMDKPSRDGASKDSWYSGIGGIDVHYSSGPANHFFYLLSEGSGAKTINGVSYDSPTADGLAVTGIGRAKAEQIWFRALVTKFTSSTNYAGARTGTLAAAGELYGTTGTEYAAVQDAWAAVGVGARSGGGDPTDPPGDGSTFENTADVQIPDYGAAVTSPITVTGRTGNAPANLQVSVDIAHSWRGDLQIDLVAPNGATARLKSSGYDPAPDVHQTWTVNASSVAANGVWKLRVQDKGPGDTGYIDGWKITFP
ncbi:M4 family metallopeptidase [Streptomyces sp. SID8352]|uniref:M4 family metallopeptidase n=1 Tax=Streptomyces sp. SID8352 TaxID=2690338 RepID=UPI00136AD59D|nr:M4 family metallopeptidase [Streptomyces sp. SID8352]